MEIGVSLVAWFGRAARLARGLEAQGFSSVLFTDSQNLCPEVWSQLAVAAVATDRIGLGPGVTNSVTRDPALTACAAVTLQAESQGRARLCIGRGDSAVQRIGRREQPVADFALYLEQLQAYLRGDAVDRHGFASRLEFLRALGDLPKVPLEVMATGPRVIELSARVADRVCFAVGANPEFLADRIAAARAAAEVAGRDPASLELGAMINCVAHDDLGAARDAIRGGATTFARFSSFRGNDLARLPAPLQEAVAYIREHYDMKNHTRANVAHTQGISDAFVDWFGVVGPVARVCDRFRELADLGLDFVHVVPGSTDADRAIVGASLQAIAKDVIPQLQG
ncbi:MAG: LLM class flavin-dependent oxidoreductase [Proteobacteria bacterium]|nr:LLM class flavin-dependent oxidoreductase [Pseudomonadota bacterium]